MKGLENIGEYWGEQSSVRKIYTSYIRAIFIVRKRSCRKVMFLHLFVSHSGHFGGVYPSIQWAGGRADIPLGRHPPGYTPLDTPQDGHLSGRYASYCNAFLLFLSLLLRKIFQ